MTVIKGLLIPANENAPATVVEFDQSDITNIQNYVGGWFETLTLGDDLSAWVNEEGRIIGLPYNQRATVFVRIYRTHLLGRAERLVGDVLILGGTDEHGDILSVPEEMFKHVESLVAK